MKKFLLSLCCFVYAFIVYAGPVSEQQALAKASQFMPGKGFVLAKPSAKKEPGGSTPYYVFNAKGNAGFVIVSGDDRTKPILGYSEKGTLNENAVPENVQWWLNYYAKAISSLEDNPAKAQPESVTAQARSTISPLVKTQWDQGFPYNNMCYFDGLGQCLTGCVATAMAQVVNFHKYPKKLPEIGAYTATWSGNYFNALLATTLNWKNMTDEDIARLCRYCGQSVEMDYGTDCSSATSEFVSVALVKYFGYNKSAHAIYSKGYSAEEWENEIYQELAAGYPVFYSGRTISNSGHAFVVDGYKDGLYHVNWGWGGWCDTYFVLTVMDSMGPNNPDWTFSEDQSAIVGVRPTKGGTLDYPLITISQLELAQGQDREVTRGSADDDFYVPISYLFDNSVNSEDDLAGGGLALYKGKELVQSLLQWGPSQQRPGWYWYGTYGFQFGAGLADGKYRIEGVYVDGDYNLHQAQGFGYRYIEAVIKGNKMTLTNYPLPGTVKLNKSKVTIQMGKTVTLKATVSPSTADESLTWESSNTKVATVTSAGKVKGVKAGTATITCTSNSTGAKATCKVTVGYVELDKTEATILKGKTTTLTATVYPSSLKDKSVTWESSNTKIATVTSAGKVKGVKVGTATITCTSNATCLKATCTVKVVNGIVTLNKTEACVQKGKTMTLKATVTPETLADKSVTWESSDTKIATVTSAGKVKGVKYGTATITCTSVATGVKATCQVTVGKVVIGTSEVTIKKSRSVMLYATIYPTDLADKSVTWKSSDTKVATVNAEGIVKGIKAGTVTITCTSVATGLKGTCTVTVLSNSEARSMIGDEDELTGLKELESPAVEEPFDVYDLSGRKVLHQVTSLDGLSDGIYIVNGKKILKKKQ